MTSNSDKNPSNNDSRPQARRKDKDHQEWGSGFPSNDNDLPPQWGNPDHPRTTDEHPNIEQRSQSGFAPRYNNQPGRPTWETPAPQPRGTESRSPHSAGNKSATGVRTKKIAGITGTLVLLAGIIAGTSYA